MDWVRLGDVCTFINGDRGVNYPSQNDLQDTGIPFINAGHLKNNMVSFDRMNYISENKYKKLSSGKIQKGDILYCIRGSLGKKAVVDFETGAIASSLVILRPTASKILPEFLAYSLDSKNIENQITAANNGSSQPNLSAKSVKDFVIKIPTLPTQFQIVQKLSKLDELILLRTRQLYSLDQLVKSRFIEMFGNVEKALPLSDVGTITGGLTKNAKREKLELHLPYLRVANVFFAHIDTNEILEIGLTAEERDKTLLKDGDLLFVEGNGSPDQIGRVAIWHNEVPNCVHQNHLIKVRFDAEKILPEFAMHYFMTQDGRNQIKKVAVSTSGLYTLSVSKIGNLVIPVSSLKRQEQFVALAQQADKSKFAIWRSLEKLETMKKSDAGIIWLNAIRI